MVFILLAACVTRAAGSAGKDASPNTPADESSVIIMLRNGPADPLALSRAETNRAGRARAVVSGLQAQANAAQPAVLAHLEQMRARGKVKQIRPFWIINAVAVTVQTSSLAELSALPGVASVVPNRPLVLADRVSPAQTSGTAANLEQIHAPEVWAKGYTGQGIVVANLDTGVSLDTPLAANYRGGANSWYDVQGEYTTPYDPDGHGTATMSLMVGADYGVAPGARWMAVKIFPSPASGAGATDADAISGLQWVLAPNGDPSAAPDVVNNSWSADAIDPTQPCADSAPMHAALQALAAADILPVFAAGNFGPSSPSAPVPSSYPEVVAVGAIGADNAIAAFSSRGPTNCRLAGSAFPDLSAPGVGVPFYSPSGGISYGSGTSFAAPHVAGALAVLFSAFPHLSSATQRSILLNSAADLGTPGVDDVYGYGRLDVLAMYNRMLQTEIFYLPMIASGAK
mgnify:CR=1 FL=1